MKTTIRKSYGMKNKIILTAGVVLVMLITIVSIARYIYTNSIDQCYEKLSVQATLIKTEIFMRMEADSEQLKTIANFSAPLFEGEGIRKIYSELNNHTKNLPDTDDVHREFLPIFNSFRKNGLIDELEILIPGNILITSSGAYSTGQDDLFERIVARGAHISNSRKSYIGDTDVIHNAVPVVCGDETVAVLMGIVNVSKLSEIYTNLLEYDGSHLHIVEGESGKFMVNSEGVSKGNISGIAASECVREKFASVLRAGEKGCLEYKSLEDDTFIFVGYDTVDINDWRIVVAMPEQIVFSEARKSIATTVFLTVILVILMLIYIWFFFVDSRKRLRLTLASSVVRKLLLESGRRNESFYEALMHITKVVKSRTAFYVDTDGEFYDYVNPQKKSVELSSSARNKLVDCLISYSDSQKREIFVKSIFFTEQLRHSNPEMYAVMSEQNIQNVIFTVIWDKNNRAAIMGVIDGKNTGIAPMLLADVAMCFSMTVHSRKYLNATEQAAITDTLTGLTNRTGYNKDVGTFRIKDFDTLACLYIDVNELHAHNNKYGHLSGDKMLITIANFIKEAFDGDKVYRWGGDEFIVFAENADRASVEEKIETIKSKTEEKNYHISVGLAYTDTNKDIEALLNEAEKNMYEAKAKYYQEKSKKVVPAVRATTSVDHITTGNSDLDLTLSVMTNKYTGIYVVNLDEDTARIILIVKAFDVILEKEHYFSKAMKVFMDNNVEPDYHREFTNFMNYDIIKSNLAQGIRPRMVYRRITGEQIVVTVYPHNNPDNSSETLWVFES